MIYNVSSLLKASIGAQMTVGVQEGPRRLANILEVRYLQGSLRLTHTGRRILVQAHLEVETPSECVRCLEPFALKVIVRFDELFTFYPDSPPDKMYHIDEDGFLHLERPLTEQVQLALPIKPLCRPDCKGLCAQCGQNWNEVACDCSDSADDPRLAGLRALLE